jgi:hypothetical protein
VVYKEAPDSLSGRTVVNEVTLSGSHVVTRSGIKKTAVPRGLTAMGSTQSKTCTACFWTFQAVNTLGSLSFSLFPETSHRSMIKNPDQMLQEFGFGPLQYGMLLNQVRGWNTALLAVSLFGYIKGPQSSDFFQLAFITSVLTTYAHVQTGIHHAKEERINKYLSKEGVNPFAPAFASAFLGLITGWAVYKSR